MYINNVLYCFYSSDTEALEACFRLLHDDDDDDDDDNIHDTVVLVHQLIFIDKLDIFTDKNKLLGRACITHVNFVISDDKCRLHSK